MRYAISQLEVSNRVQDTTSHTTLIKKDMPRSGRVRRVSESIEAS
jgi:hypothetical protein